MGKSLQELLAPRNYTGVYEIVSKGVPKVLPDSFYLGTGSRKVIGYQAQYFKITGSRVGANTQSYGTPPDLVQGQNMVQVPVNLLHTIEAYRHNVLALQGLIDPQNEAQQAFYLGEIDRQSANFGQRFTTLRTNAVHSAFANGKIWVGSTGQVLTSASGAVNTIDYSVLSQTASATWASTGTNIIGQIEEKKREQLQRGKAPFKWAIHGKNIANYILSNNTAKELINRTPVLATQAYMNTSTIPNGFAGLNWASSDGAFSVNSAGAVTEWFDGDQITFLPDQDPNWYETMEGSYGVPTQGIAFGNDPVAVARSLQLVYGMFGWCYMDHQHPSVVQVGGDTFMPIIRDGDSVLRFDTVP
jgi:hypothetical protein